VLRKPPVQVAAGTAEAASAHIKTIVARIRLVNTQIKQALRQLDALTAKLIPAEDAEPRQAKQHDVEILASLPGVGRIVLATLLAEAWDALQRRDYAALRSLTGVAPVTKRSGKSCIVIRRQACSNRLANAVYHWSRVAIQIDPKSKAKYAALRSRGHSHGRALRSVADRLLNVACVMLKNGTTFDPSLEAQNAT
jgi:transposase